VCIHVESRRWHGQRREGHLAVHERVAGMDDGEVATSFGFFALLFITFQGLRDGVKR
jgi:hypothetical protein